MYIHVPYDPSNHVEVTFIIRISTLAVKLYGYSICPSSCIELPHGEQLS